MSKTLLPMLLFGALLACLLNSNAFGAPSLIAFFLYSLLACSAMFFMFSRLIVKSAATGYRLPPNLWWFTALCGYVLLHGLLMQRFELTHFYWMVNTLLLLAVNGWLYRMMPEQRTKMYFFIINSILILAVLESILVLLQCMRVAPVPNKYFWCTGSWSNPNVTAMFLTLSIVAWQQTTNRLGAKLRIVIISVVLLAIAVLQCRSAWLAAMVLLLYAYGMQWWAWIRKNLRFNLTGFGILIVAAVVLQGLFNLFTVKQASTASRVQIWSNSAKIFADQPLIGSGFGMFEQTYNLHAAQQEYEVNDHVAMPYNDFIELAIEGGILPVLLYIAFLVVTAWRYPRMRPVVAAFVIIQLTNFGFQAIPAMVLFTLYTALFSVPAESRSPAPALVRLSYAGTGMALVTLLFVQVASLTGAFYKKWKLSRRPAHTLSFGEISALKKPLSLYPTFQEQWGDYYSVRRLPRPAVNHYLTALRYCSQPDVLAKCANSYMQLHMYDSTEYYFSLVSHMQPHKFVPRMNLLQFYQLRGDTAKALTTASTIVQMPIKVRSKRVAEIRGYAQQLLKARERSLTKTDDYSPF